VPLDIFNVLNTQRAILLDERYGFPEERQGATQVPNPTYLKPIVHTDNLGTGGGTAEFCGSFTENQLPRRVGKTSRRTLL
jgi:hypothetical protein